MTVVKQINAISSEIDEIQGIIAAIAAAHRAKDAAAIARHYAPDAVIADLAPPLVRRGLDRDATQAWLDGWDGPVELTTRDLAIEADGDLAVCHGLQHTRATRAGEEVAWWSRLSIAFKRTPAGWRIVHEHSSVPFYMDGSFRAAVDLEP